MTPRSPLLQIRQLDFAHPAEGRQSPVPVFSQLSASLAPGVSWVGGGESRGKTTLLRLLAGELQPQAGALQLGALPWSAPQAAPAAWRSQVAWFPNGLAGQDALRPAACFDQARQRHPRFSDDALADLIEGLDLAQHLDKSLYMLSTGTRRKVWLAATLASGTPLTLMDEPFAALDRGSIDFLRELLREAAQHTERAWVIAAYSAPAGVPLSGQLDLGD
ncbi:ATP-binding cassette domain-containing protein [Curvibacter sp. HBC61]|uniref:ATP-binding cassette domain-containing protein n=1 Tax=Curvibacter cyanobacteriorum TaxID=3026422 RepID=A0ABT5MTZ8_9BURK|nr:ATP-binding cassette domain-containing protein [Curvibacter sp. HBC61]MDD0837283.1 ATP-binding cassette domain-containing protein [Curvibacter sp. HBC61]